MSGLPTVPDSAGTALTPELATALGAAMDFAAEAFSDGTKRVPDSLAAVRFLVSPERTGLDAGERPTLALWMAALRKRHQARHGRVKAAASPGPTPIRRRSPA